VDGGVDVTGDPVYQACVEAFYYDDFTPADTGVVPLGTGFFPTCDERDLREDHRSFPLSLEAVLSGVKIPYG
jgi:hypothetical protein